MEMLIIANFDSHMGLHLDQVKFALWYKQPILFLYIARENFGPFGFLELTLFNDDRVGWLQHNSIVISKTFHITLKK